MKVFCYAKFVTVMGVAFIGKAGSDYAIDERGM